MSKRIYIHAGMHKTASSSIQETLFQHKALAESNNYYYPKHWRANHNFLYGMFCEKPEEFYENVFAKRSPEEVTTYYQLLQSTFLEEMALQTCDNVILSAEDLSVLSRAGVERLKAFFERTLPEYAITIVLFTRNTLDFVTSDVQQKIKTGYGYNLQTFRDLYRSRLEKFVEVFGRDNVVVVKFEDAVKHETGPVGFFMRTIGMPDDLAEQIDMTKSNESLSCNAVALIRFINGRVPIIRNGNLAYGRQFGDTRLLEGLKGAKFHLDDRETREVLDLAVADIEWLKELFGIDYTGQEIQPSRQCGRFSKEHQSYMYNCFEALSPLVKELCYRYVSEKAAVADGEEAVLLSEAVAWMQPRRERERLLLPFKNALSKVQEGSEAVDMISEVGVALGQVGDTKAALKMLEWALVFRPDGEFIKQFHQRYTAVLNNESI